MSSSWRLHCRRLSFSTCPVDPNTPPMTHNTPAADISPLSCGPVSVTLESLFKGGWGGNESCYIVSTSKNRPLFLTLFVGMYHTYIFICSSVFSYTRLIQEKKNWLFMRKNQTWGRKRMQLGEKKFTLSDLSLQLMEWIK